VIVGLIGAGIGSSLSPALHEREASLLGVDYEYRLFDLDELGRPASDVGALVAEAARDGFGGLNVTHPCKQLVVDELDDPVRARAGQAALERLLEAAGVRVVTDPPAVAQHDRVDRPECLGLGRELV